MGAGDIQLQRGLPGIGEFQCYDKYMMESLKLAALEVGEEEWYALCSLRFACHAMLSPLCLPCCACCALHAPSLLPQLQ